MAEYKAKLLKGLFSSAKKVLLTDGSNVEDSVKLEYLYNTATLKIWKRGNQVFLSAQGVTCDSNYKIAELSDGWKPIMAIIPTCLTLYNSQWKWAYLLIDAQTGTIHIGSIPSITVGGVDVGSAVYGQCTWLVS